jgi:hypothetical protein
MGLVSSGFTIYSFDLFNETSTASADFSTGYQWIGLPSSVWLALCNNLQVAVNLQNPPEWQARYPGNYEVNCDWTSNVNNLLTMGEQAAQSMNFTISMLD